LNERAGTGRSNGARRVARTLVEATLLALAVTTFVVSTVAIQGDSMEPTLRDGDRVLVPRYETWLHRFGVGSFGRGDVVYFPDPQADGAFPPHLIKRIVALEGEVVSLVDGVLHIDGEPRAEPYLSNAWRVQMDVTPVAVPAGHVYVLGDNRSPLGSIDSRRFGPVPLQSVKGRAGVIVWPLDHAVAFGAQEGPSASVGR
jgi:signal peptidase I